MKRHSPFCARCSTTAALLALLALSLSATSGTAAARPLPSAAPPRLQHLLPATAPVPWSPTARSALRLFPGSATTLPPPDRRTPLAGISGAQADGLPPASLPRFTIFAPRLHPAAHTQAAQPDSPPLRPAALLPPLRPAALRTSAPPATAAPAVFRSPTVGAAPAASLRLERIEDSQVLSAPLPVLLHPGDPSRDALASARRPAAPVGLKLTGVQVQETVYQQPPTATPTPTPTDLPPTATSVPPTALATATATTPAPTATAATPPPTATATSARPVAVAASEQPAGAPTVVWSAPVPTAVPPAAASPAPVPVLPASSTAVPQALPAPAHAAWFAVTGYVATGARTATGTWPTVGRTIAVDPAVIPLGSTVYIAGLGVFLAEDTGGGVVGRHVDVFVSTVTEAYAITGERLVSWTPR